MQIVIEDLNSFHLLEILDKLEHDILSTWEVDEDRNTYTNGNLNVLRLPMRRFTGKEEYKFIGTWPPDLLRKYMQYMMETYPEFIVKRMVTVDIGKGRRQSHLCPHCGRISRGFFHFGHHGKNCKALVTQKLSS